MNIVAKNLAWNYQNKRPEFLQINDKIMEEIIERSLKHNRSFLNPNQNDIIEILTHARKKTDIFDLLDSQRKIVLNKKFLSGNFSPFKNLPSYNSRAKSTQHHMEARKSPKNHRKRNQPI